MEETEINIGIPKLYTLDDGRWERTWTIMFASSVQSPALSEVCRNLSDASIEVWGKSVTKKEATITLRSGPGEEYVYYWDNGFRIMLLLGRQLVLVKEIQGRERDHWRRFFFYADHEATLDRYKTSLMTAAKAGDKKTVIEQLREVNQIDERSFSGKTALMYAAQYGHPDVVEFLLNRGASIELSEPEWTPLQLATLSGSVEFTCLFLDAGAQIDGQNYYGETALMQAVARGETDIVELLLKRGANVYLSDQRGTTADDWAPRVLQIVSRKDQYERIMQLLKQFLQLTEARA